MAVGFVAGELVLTCVSLEDAGLPALVFGALFGVPESVESTPGVLRAGGFAVEAGTFLDTALTGRVVLVTLDFVGERAVAALLGLSGFFVSSTLDAAVLLAGFFVPGEVAVDFAAGALVATEGLDAGTFVAGALTSFLDVAFKGFVAPGCFFAAAGPVDGVALVGNLADFTPADWGFVFVIFPVFFSVGKAWIFAGLASFSTGLTSSSEGLTSSSAGLTSSSKGLASSSTGVTPSSVGIKA